MAIRPRSTGGRPRRLGPRGIERNVVITLWDWADRTAYLHDEVSTDHRDPTVNANGPIYGALVLHVTMSMPTVSNLRLVVPNTSSSVRRKTRARTKRRKKTASPAAMRARRTNPRLTGRPAGACQRVGQRRSQRRAPWPVWTSLDQTQYLGQYGRRQKVYPPKP